MVATTSLGHGSPKLYCQLFLFSISFFSHMFGLKARAEVFPLNRKVYLFGERVKLAVGVCKQSEEKQHVIVESCRDGTYRSRVTHGTPFLYC